MRKFDLILTLGPHLVHHHQHEHDACTAAAFTFWVSSRQWIHMRRTSMLEASALASQIQGQPVGQHAQFR
jgi:hypothetical protein